MVTVNMTKSYPDISASYIPETGTETGYLVLF